ncbi:alginate export family protein [Granulicella tundricola]|uniref:alginate export family protein n=1 Tax=Granulicella tundricola TaxID=940615 RepID=UPI000326D103|nr:alginate export family protein [Granulicella tundricola]
MNIRCRRTIRTNLFAALAVSTLLPGIVFAQTPAPSSAPATTPAQAGPLYADYPQKRGKVQPLQFETLPSWATLNMELRGRTEGQTSINYTENGDRTYELTRVYGGLEVRPTKYVTGYLQFIDTHALGLPLHVVAANMRDVFDLRQGYVNVHLKPGKVPVELIAGRQELKFDSERIIGISDWTNNSRSWDGFDARIGDKNRIDLFSTSVVAVHASSLDKHGAGLTFHGAYATLGTWVPHVRLSPYVLFHDVRGVTSQQNIKGNEVETTFGAEVQGNLPANFSYEANGSLQRGSYSNDSIHAGQNFDKLWYTAKTLPWQPRLGGEFDYATGNDHKDLTRIGTYDQQYPSNHNAFGLVDLFGYQNIRQERINLDLGPTKNLSLLVQGGFLNLATTKDSLYSSSGSVTIKAPTAGFNSTDIGKEFDASAKYVFHDYIVANVGVGHLFPGQMLIGNNHGAADTIGYFSLTYRYRVDKHSPKP